MTFVVLPRIDARGRRRIRSCKAFTLVEMVIVLALIGVVMAIALPLYERFVEKSRVMDTVMQITTIASKIRDYQLANGALPINLATVGHGATVDPWGRNFTYVIITGPGVARKDKKTVPINSDYDLYSMGRDGASNNSLGHASSRDDILRARDGRFVGIVEEFDP